jgi:SNF2 family DNA or RNA helicase
MSSSPSASLTLDFLGLSLVDTPPSDKKGKAKRPIQNESRPDARHSRPIVLDDDDDDDILESSCDDRDDPTMNATSDRNRYYAIDSTLEEEDDEEDSILEHIDESEKDPVWILQSEKNGYVLNDQCTSYDTAIQWPRLTLSRKMHTKLYPHQKIGVRWLASLHHRAEKFGVGGGILGDDMVGLPWVLTMYILKYPFCFNNHLQFFIRVWGKQCKHWH